MSDYLPLDLTGLLNAPVSILPHPSGAPSGDVTFRGLPFRLGPAEQALLAFESHRSDSVAIPIAQPAHRVILLHALLDSKLLDGGPLGLVAADYTFVLADGERVRVPIRERFEIGLAPASWGQWPFVCHPDTGEQRLPRQSGRWGGAGNRLTETTMGVARWFYLYVWTPPRPGQRVAALEVQPRELPFVIAGVTIGRLDEDPVTRDAAVPVIVEVPEGKVSGLIEVDVDRGQATYAQPLPAESNAAYQADPMKGFGQPSNPLGVPATANVAAPPSATLAVRQSSGELLGEVNWGELRRDGEARGGRVQVRLAEGGRNWVHTRVVDADSGETLPCRVHFRSPDGIPYQPHGHHPYACSNLESWHYDVGGDVKLGQVTYAYIDGTCQGWLPRGEVVVDVARGFEHEPLRATVQIERGQRALELKLRRVRDMNAERYFSGDSHVHFLSTAGAHLEAAGEGLNVVNLLQSQWGQLFTNTEEFRGEASVRAGQKTIVYAAQENRQHMLGHLTLLNQKRPIMPWCSGGPSESQLGDNLETTLSRWADECHAQGGTVVLPHLPNPNGEPATLLATGRVDAVEFLREDFYHRQEYYRYLNAGYRLPLVGGTDKMTQDVPVGIYRTYVYIPADEDLTYDNWCRCLRGGNTFHSGGPLLTFTVEGQMPGSSVALPGNGGTVRVHAIATSIFPIRELQIVRQGKPVASVAEPNGTNRLELDVELKIDAHTWLAARVGDLDQPVIAHRDGWQRGVMAHTSPVYLAVGGEWELFDAETVQYLLTLIDGSLSYLRERSPQFPDDQEKVTHAHSHHDHLEWLSEPFHEARGAIHRRLHQHGIPH